MFLPLCCEFQVGALLLSVLRTLLRRTHRLLSVILLGHAPEADEVGRFSIAFSIAVSVAVSVAVSIAVSVAVSIAVSVAVSIAASVAVSTDCRL